jgi:hypothetical protein
MKLVSYCKSCVVITQAIKRARELYFEYKNLQKVKKVKFFLA